MRDEAERIVREFLAAIEARDVERGQRLLASDARIIFPGGVERSSMADIVAGSAVKYRVCSKTFERFDSLHDANGDTIVYCFGTLHGEWADGRAFAGIRYIDRFVLRNGVIHEQLVWNDTGFFK